MPYDVFISHAGEDKIEVALPLAKLLQAGGCEVWIDNFELRPGDNLRRKIDHGLTESDYGVVVLSPAFFAKDWPQLELDALLQKEMAGRVKGILPVRHNVTQEYVVQHAPTLAGYVSASTEQGIDFVATELLRVLRPGTRSAAIAHVPAGCPAPPLVRPYYVRRNAHAATQEILRSALPDQRPPLVIVTGPSGYGKSTFASQIAAEWPTFDWFDAEHPLSPTPKHFASPDTLLVIDNLDHVFVDREGKPHSGPDRLFSLMPWLAEAKASMLVTCRRPEVPRMFLSYMARQNDRTGVAIRDLGRGFDQEETWRFVANTIPAHLLGAGTAVTLNERVRGCPFLWQILLELIHDRDLADIDGIVANAADDREIRERIYRLWFEHLEARDPLTHRAAYVLCTVSQFAMDLAALAHLLRQPAALVEGAIAPLIRRGFVSRACSGDAALTPHALLRDACRVVPSPVPLDSLERTYAEYMRTRLANPAGIRASFITLVDAWVTSVRDAFSAVSRRDLAAGANGYPDIPAFAERFRALTLDLQTTLSGAERNEQQIRWLADAFRDQIEDMRCSELIGTAQVMGRLPQRNASLAEILWLALSPSAQISWYSEHGDGWARAECVRAACIHWSGEEKEERRKAAKRVLGRLSDCRRAFSDEGWSRMLARDGKTPAVVGRVDRNGIEHEVCALICGLLLLDQTPTVQRVLDEPFYATELTNVYYAGALYLSENSTREDLDNFRKRYWARLPASGHKTLVDYCLHQRALGGDAAEAGEVSIVPNYWMLLGDLAYAPRFKELFWRLLHTRPVVTVDDNTVRLKL